MFLLSSISLLSSVFLFTTIKKNRSCAGISYKSQLLLAAVYFINFITDTSKLLGDAESDFFDILDYLVNLASTASILYIAYLIQTKYKHTYDKNHDSFRITFLLIPSVLLSLLFGPTSLDLNESYFISKLSAFSIVLKSVALLPQYIQLSRTKDIETLTPNYVISLIVYRVGTVLLQLVSQPSAFLVLFGIIQVAFDILFFHQFFKIPNYTISLN